MKPLLIKNKKASQRDAVKFADVSKRSVAKEAAEPAKRSEAVCANIEDEKNAQRKIKGKIEVIQMDIFEDNWIIKTHYLS